MFDNVSHFPDLLKFSSSLSRALINDLTYVCIEEEPKMLRESAFTEPPVSLLHHICKYLVHHRGEKAISRLTEVTNLGNPTADRLLIQLKIQVQPHFYGDRAHCKQEEYVYHHFFESSLGFLWLKQQDFRSKVEPSLVLRMFRATCS